MARRNEKSITQPVVKKSSDIKPSVSIAGKRVAPLPHERDEAADSETSAPRKVMKQAATDIANGLEDTDRGAQVNRTYQKLKAKP